MERNFKNLFGMIKEKSVPIIDPISEQTRNAQPKAYIPKFIYKPPFGYPRFVDLPNIRRLAASPYVDMCITTSIDELCAVPWDIVAKEGKEDSKTLDAHIEHVKSFYDNPNTNKESFEDIRKQYLRDIFEIDAGVLIKMFSKVTGQMVEMIARDGATFTKNPDIYGMMTDRDDIILDANIAVTSAEINKMEPGWMNAADVREKAAYFQYGWISGARPVPFGKKELIWFQRNSRTDSIYGRSPVQVLAETIQTLIYAIEHNLEYFSDNQIPRGIIGLEGSNTEEVKAFKDQWKENQRVKDSAGNWRKKFHNIPVTNKTPVFTRLELSNSELELLEGQKWWAKLVWACFGVTSTELGYTEDAKGMSNQIVQSNVFKKRTLNPMLRMEEYKHNQEIISEFEYDDVEFKFLMFDVEEETKKAQLYQTQLSAGYKSVNEIRVEEGLDEVDWGDKQSPEEQMEMQQRYSDPLNQEKERFEDESKLESRTDKKKDEKSFELKFKYIKRTGSPGNYTYWYRDSLGKLSAGKKPEGAEFHNIKDVREEIREMIENPKYDLPELSDKMVKEIDKVAGEIIEEVREEEGSAAASIEKMRIEKMVSFLERYRNVSNLDNQQVNDLFQETDRRAQHIKETDDLYQRLDTKPAQEKFNKVLESIDKAKKSKSRLDRVLAIDRFVNAVHQDFPASMLPRGFDISEPIEAAGIVIPYLDYARGKETKALQTGSPLILGEFETMDENRLKRSIIYLMKVNETKIKSLLEKEMGNSTLIKIKSVDDVAKRIKVLITFAGLKTISDAVIKNMFMEGHDSAERQVARNLMINKDAISFIQDYTFNNIKGMTDEIVQDLRQELERGIMSGEGITKLKNRVSKVFDVGETRAEAISRTEATRSENQGKLQAFKSSGEELVKKWNTHFDGRTSEVCKRLDGQTVGINENFKDKKTGWEGPCPPSHVNCRSSVLYIEKEESLKEN